MICGWVWRLMCFSSIRAFNDPLPISISLVQKLTPHVPDWPGYWVCQLKQLNWFYLQVDLGFKRPVPCGTGSCSCSEVHLGFLVLKQRMLHIFFLGFQIAYPSNFEICEFFIPYDYTEGPSAARSLSHLFLRSFGLSEAADFGHQTLLLSSSLKLVLLSRNVIR